MGPRLILVLAALGLMGGSLTVRADDGDKTRVTLQADSEPVLAVLKRLCATHGYNFVADDAALQRAGKVSLSLTDVSFDDALEAICDAYGLEGRVRGLDAHPIVVIRLRAQERDARDKDARERAFTDDRPASGRPSGNRFLEGIGPGTARIDHPAPQPGSPAAAPVSTQTAIQAPAPLPYTAPTAAAQVTGTIVVGVVVEVKTDQVTLKEAAGDPRDFVLPAADLDGPRNERLARGLSYLKKGDRVGIEYKPDNGRLVIQNLVGGGKPPENP